MPPKVAHRHNMPVSCHLREDLRHTVINSGHLICKAVHSIQALPNPAKSIPEYKGKDIFKLATGKGRLSGTS
jgi:hypothetical protein